jgi:hypothetical protein
VNEPAHLQSELAHSLQLLAVLPVACDASETQRQSAHRVDSIHRSTIDRATSLPSHPSRSAARYVETTEACAQGCVPCMALVPAEDVRWCPHMGVPSEGLHARCIHQQASIDIVETPQR